MNIGIIGLGYVGLTLGITAATNGIEVYGIEIDEKIKESLSHNRAHFYEPGLDSLIKRCNNKSFFVVDNFPDDKSYDAFIITVGTPLGEGEKTPNFNYICQALETIKNIYDGSQLVVLRSTVSVGTTRNIVLPYLSKMINKDKDEILVSMCPERTLEGVAVHELTNLPQVISGNNKESLRIAAELFRLLTPTIIEATSLEEAELIKLYCNTYRDMTFAIGNAFCMAAQEFGVDGLKAIEHANFGYSRSNIAKPGFVAGPCLEKDAYILINNMPNCPSRNFILDARQFNESMEDRVVEWVKYKIGVPSDDKIIAISGMAFKGVPETSDLRGSSSVYIAKKLRQIGYKLHLHDFVAMQKEMEALELGEVFEDIFESCQEARLLLVLNNNKRYSTLFEDDSILYEKNDFEILDSWNVCTEWHNIPEIKIYTLGNMFN